MSDKNRTPEEDYLDSLLRSITGGNDEEELDDNFIAEDMDFDKEVNAGMSEEEFLSDFEKEFFGADIDEVGTTKAEPSSASPIMSQEPEVSADTMSFPEFEMPSEDLTFPELEMPVESVAEPQMSDPIENITLDEPKFVVYS